MAFSRSVAGPVGGQLGWRLEPTELNVWLLAAPMAVMAAMHTTTIRASMTAYSTAVGPSSRFRNSTTRFRVFVTAVSGWWDRFDTAPYPTPPATGRESKGCRN